MHTEREKNTLAYLGFIFTLVTLQMLLVNRRVKIKTQYQVCP